MANLKRNGSIFSRAWRATYTFNPSTWEAEAGESLVEFSTSLVHRASSRRARDTQRNPVSKQTKPKRKQTKQTKVAFGGWRDGSVVKSTGCSSRGLRFCSQHPYGGSHVFNSCSRGSTAPIWPLWALHACGAQT